MFYHCKNKSRKLEVCGREYFRVRVRIIESASQQISGVSRTFNFNFQDFPARTKIVFQDFSGVGNFYNKFRTFQ